MAPASEWLHSPQQNNQQSVAQQAQQQSNSMHVASDSLTPDMGEEVSAIDDRGLPMPLSFFYFDPLNPLPL